MIEHAAPEAHNATSEKAGEIGGNGSGKRRHAKRRSMRAVQSNPGSPLPALGKSREEAKRGIAFLFSKSGCRLHIRETSNPKVREQMKR
jgi:hypothetical protein